MGSWPRMKGAGGGHTNHSFLQINEVFSKSLATRVEFSLAGTRGGYFSPYTDERWDTICV